LLALDEKVQTGRNDTPAARQIRGDSGADNAAPTREAVCIDLRAVAACGCLLRRGARM